MEKDGFVLFVSRVVPGKGLEYLMDAYKQINTDLPLIIAGDSVFVDDFYQMIREKASPDNRVKLIGFVQGDILRELYSNAKLFVFPSEAEGMPMCLLEALSYDCNCLVSDIPENLEVGKEYVHSFHTCDADDLRVKLKDCLKKEGRNPLLVACDVYRPAAIKQLQINGEKQGVEVFAMGDNHKPANIAKAALEHAAKHGHNLVILDTAGRLHVDEDMMQELENIKKEVESYLKTKYNDDFKVIEITKTFCLEDYETNLSTINWSSGIVCFHFLRNI